MMSAEIESKYVLRRRARERLAQITEEERRMLSAAAANTLLAMPEVVACKRWMVFVSMAGEIDTRPLIDALLKAENLVAVPRIEPASGLMGAYRIGSLEELKKNRWGIPEPDPDPEDLIEPSASDVIVVPGLAFDAAGGRLGRAGGYYDRYLRAAGGGPLRVGFFYAVQEMPAIPQEAWDERLDAVATDSGIIRCSRPTN